jgi:hypothetical protein
VRTYSTAGWAFRSGPRINAPSDIADLILDVDMRDSACFTESAAVITSLTNRVTSTAFGTITASPGYNATVHNGKPGITLNGTSQWLSTTEAAVVAALQNDNPYTLSLTFLPSIAAGTRIASAANAASDTAGRKEWGYSAAGVVLENFESDASVSANTNFSTTLVTAVPVTVIWSGGSGTTRCRPGLGALAEAARTPGATTPTRFGLGARVDLTPNLFYAGSLSAARLYSRTITPDEWSALARYERGAWT